MSDITERLRHIRRDGCLCADKPKKAALLHPICQEAADEIERLRAALLPFTFPHFERDDGTPCSTQEVWEMIWADRFKEWVSFDDMEAARTALRGRG